MHHYKSLMLVAMLGGVILCVAGMMTTFEKAARITELDIHRNQVITMIDLDGMAGIVNETNHTLFFITLKLLVELLDGWLYFGCADIHQRGYLKALLFQLLRNRGGVIDGIAKRGHGVVIVANHQRMHGRAFFIRPRRCHHA